MITRPYPPRRDAEAYPGRAGKEIPPRPPVEELEHYVSRMELGSSGFLQGVAKRLDACAGASDVVRGQVRERVLEELAYFATCDARGFDDWRQVGQLATTLGITADPATIPPRWQPSYGTWFSNRYQRVLDEVKAGHSSEAKTYLARYRRLHPSVRHNVQSFEGIRQKLESKRREGILTCTSLRTLLDTLARQPDPSTIGDNDLLVSIRDRLTALAAQALGRGVIVHAKDLARYGVDLAAIVPAEPAAKADEAIEQRLVREFRPDALRGARWYLTDHPNDLEKLVDLGIATHRMTAAEQLWVINRARPSHDPYFESTRFPQTAAPLKDVLYLFERTFFAPLVHEAAVAALNQPQMLAQLGAYLATASSRQVVRLADDLYSDEFDVDDEAAELVANAVEERRAAAAQKLDTGTPLAVRLSAKASRYASRYGTEVAHTPVPTPDAASHARARALVERGRDFLGDAWSDVEALRALRIAPKSDARDVAYDKRLSALHTTLGAKLDELLVSRPMSEETAAALGSVLTVSTSLPYDGSRAFDRQRMRTAAITAVRLTNGESLIDAGTLVALHEGRAGYASSDTGPGGGRVRASPANREAMLHELGHAWDYARPDLVQASVALVDGLAVAPGVYSMNDLYVVEQLARYLPGLPHERLLRHFCRVATAETKLDSEGALRSVFAGLDVEQGIEALCANTNGLTDLRVYGSDELARPIVGVSYAGVVYSNGLSTEIVSTGLGALASPQQLAWELVSGPPERIAFVLGAILETC